MACASARHDAPDLTCSDSPPPRARSYCPASRFDPLSTEKRSTLDAHKAGRPNPLVIGDPRRRDGAFMEPSGRNRWQPVANGTPSKNGSNSRIGNRWQPTATVSDGKEGVRGSSPREGFASSLLVSSFCRLLRRQERDAASTARPRGGQRFRQRANRHVSEP